LILDEELAKRGFSPAPCGAECPPGWHSLVCELLDKLQGKCEIAQIKEKFGQLRVYSDPLPDWSGDWPEIEGLIAEASIASETICEVCGAPSKRESDGWISVLCELHREEQKEKRRNYGK